jgi:hypothetical protein
MKSRPPLTKIETIELSLRCFSRGLLGLIPLLGLPFTILRQWIMSGCCDAVVRTGIRRASIGGGAGRWAEWDFCCSCF